MPPFIEFDVRIRHVDATGKVTTGNEHVLLRTADHWCKTRELDSDSPQPVTSIGPSCVGPGTSPLGFNIAAQYPHSTQIDPFVSDLRTIASVHAIHYEVTLSGEEPIDGHRCYHLLLRPLGNPDYYPLRAVWVDEATSDVRKLTYAMHQNGWSGAIDYSFEPYPPNDTWWISQITAVWTPSANDRTDAPFTSSLQIENVSFP